MSKSVGLERRKWPNPLLDSGRFRPIADSRDEGPLGTSWLQANPPAHKSSTQVVQALIPIAKFFRTSKDVMLPRAQGAFSV